MQVRKAPYLVWFAVAFAFALVLSAYLYGQSLWHAFLHKTSLAKADQCDDLDQGAIVNPNKMLFISCGGFID